jgi:uncharacterized protein DUF3558
MRVRQAVMILVTVGVLAVAGCSSSTPGSADPTTSSGGASSAAATTTGQTAPKVSSPLNSSKFVSVPCSLLTASQLSALDIDNQNGEARSDSNGTQCTWVGSTGAVLSASWVTADKNGLSDLYNLKSSQPAFEITTVEGYPAVYTERDSKECTLNVGTSDNLFFFIDVNGTGGADQLSSVAQQAATDVIKNLGGA